MNSSFIIIVVLVFIVNLALIAWAVTDLLQRDNVKYLPKAGWLAIIAVIVFGSLIYLLLGRGDSRQ